MKLIINADDLGYSDIVNNTIFDLLEQRAISSATCLANGPNIAEAAARIPSFQKASFGVHLNLTEFEALTQPAAFKTEGVTDENNTFTGKFRQAPLTKELRHAVEEEWTAQIASLMQRDIAITHIDSHHHVHTIPGLFPSLKRVQKRFGIRRVRTTLDLYAPDETPISAHSRLKKRLWAHSLRWLYPTRCTHHFTSVSWFRKLQAINKHPRQGSIELMCHPCQSGEDHYQDETDLLESDWRESLPPGTVLISYRDL